MAHEAIYDAVERLLEAGSRGRLLDVPAGEGALAVRLQQAGFEVVCCDLYPEMFRADGIPVHAGDLNARLPLEDGSFEHIVCVEGLEHIENPSNAIREFARLLVPNGRLLVSVPNIMNIEERLKWLISGYTSHFKPMSGEALARIDREFPDEAALHINPIPYSELRFLLERAGFELLGVHRDKSKKNSWAHLPLVAVIRLINSIQSAAKRRERWTEELTSNEVLLGGNTLIFEARKL